MSEATVLLFMREAILVVLKVAAPPLVVGLAVGLIISIFQATTQIHEQTLAFVPKILAIFLSLMLFGGWMISQLRDFFIRMFDFAGAAMLLPWFFR